MARFAMDGITSFSTVPLRIATWLGVIVGLFSLAVAAWAFEEHFIRHVTIQGWTSLIIVVTLIAAAQFLLLGIVGSYVGRIYEQVKRRPLYIVAEDTSAAAASERERGPQSIAR
jgi:glycosyltransferase involved in cell wall biosynthesis